MTTLHLCLVSDQLPANLIPALKLRPNLVWLLSSQRMLPKAKTLRLLLKQRDIDCEIVLDNLADADIGRMDEQAQAVAFKLADRGEAIVLNATGGNKLMTLSFWNELVGLLKERVGVVYCDTRHNSLVHLLPQRRQESLGQVLDLSTYLAAYDHRIGGAKSADDSWKETAKARKPLTKWLGRNLYRDPELLRWLNGVSVDAAKCLARGDHQGAKQAFRNDLWGLRLEALRKISTVVYGIVEWHDGADSILFKSLNAARYLSGGWLEEYAWFCAVDAGAYDAQCSVTVKQNETENEMDCAIVHNNRMLIIECKTASFTSDGKGVQDVLHKLDNLSTHIGGLFAERMLLSVRPLLDDEAHVRSRAKSYQIKLVEGENIAKLQDRIAEWMGTSE